MKRSPVTVLLVGARVRAALSQRELARRASTAQSVVARIESGMTSPTWDTLERLLDACGFSLDARLQSAPVGGSHMLDDVARIRRLSPEDRLAELARSSDFFAAVRRV